jgi:predicted Zn-dependent protease
MTTIVASNGPRARRKVTREYYTAASFVKCRETRMARGWESKSVEAQQADRDRHEPAAAGPPEDAARAAHRRTLELSRARAQADLANATHPAHKSMLEAAIRAIDEQIAREKAARA